MKSILVIGIGEFGQHLAEKMAALGNHVVIADKDEGIISEMAERIPDAFVGDCSKPGVLRTMGVNNFDICIVSVGDDFFASLEITSFLKELGAKKTLRKSWRSNITRITFLTIINCRMIIRFMKFRSCQNGLENQFLSWMSETATKQTLLRSKAAACSIQIPVQNMYLSPAIISS